MSLLVEALKALADRPLPADGAANGTSSELPGADLCDDARSDAQLSAADSTLLLDSATEELLESTASAVAESLRDEASHEPETLQAEATVAQANVPSAQASEADWAEIWQQALATPGSAVSPADESIADANASANDSEMLSAEQPEMGKKLESIFAPWFAAHGLATEPVDTADSNAASQEEVNVESPEIETGEPPEAEVIAEIQHTPAPAPIPKLYSTEVDQEHSVDPTWELYDRSAELSAPWGLQEADPVDARKPSEPATDGPDGPASTPAGHVSNETHEQVKTEEPVAAAGKLPQPIAIPVSEQPNSAPSEEEIPSKKYRSPAVPKQPERAAAAVPKPLTTDLPTAQAIEEIRVSEPYLRLASRLLQSLRTARPQAVILAAADETSSQTLDTAQLAKAITLSEEGKLLFIQAHQGRPDLSRRLGIIPDQHPRWQGGAGGELYQRIHCSGQGRIDLLPRENLFLNSGETVDPLLIARCKRHYPLVLVDVGVVSDEIARSLAPQGDAALLVAVMQHTPREIAAQSTALLRRLGVRTAGCVLMEPRPASSASRKLSR